MLVCCCCCWPPGQPGWAYGLEPIDVLASIDEEADVGGMEEEELLLPVARVRVAPICGLPLDCWAVVGNRGDEAGLSAISSGSDRRETLLRSCWNQNKINIISKCVDLRY